MASRWTVAQYLQFCLESGLKEHAPNLLGLFNKYHECPEDDRPDLGLAITNYCLHASYTKLYNRYNAPRGSQQLSNAIINLSVDNIPVRSDDPSDNTKKAIKSGKTAWALIRSDLTDLVELCPTMQRLGQPWNNIKEWGPRAAASTVIHVLFLLAHAFQPMMSKPARGLDELSTKFS